MKNRILFAPALFLVASIVLFGGCKKDQDTQPTGTGTVSFEMENMAGGKTVTADGSTVFTTADGETFTVSTLKYYVSNVVLTKADGSTYAVPSYYHLVDASKPTTTAFTISGVPAGNYSAMQFMVGVDSTATKADPLALTGDLNPANSMYWAWNSGHIFLKLEGNVTSFNNKALVVHIGGYRQPYYAAVTAKPSFNGNVLQVRTDHSPEIHLSADVRKIFDGSTKFPLKTFTVSMSPNATSVQIAQNYGVGTDGAGMFAVEHIHAN